MEPEDNQNASQSLSMNDFEKYHQQVIKMVSKIDHFGNRFPSKTNVKTITNRSRTNEDKLNILKTVATTVGLFVVFSNKK